jgi:large subunit ribosomal protein L14
VSFIGDFIKASVRKTRPENWLQKKSKVRGIILHTRKETFKRDGSYVKFQQNRTILLKLYVRAISFKGFLTCM